MCIRDRYSEAQDVRDAVDPRAQNEDLGDDAVRSSMLEMCIRDR